MSGLVTVDTHTHLDARRNSLDLSVAAVVLSMNHSLSHYPPMASDGYMMGDYILVAQWGALRSIRCWR